MNNALSCTPGARESRFCPKVHLIRTGVRTRNQLNRDSRDSRNPSEDQMSFCASKNPNCPFSHLEGGNALFGTVGRTVIVGDSRIAKGRRPTRLASTLPGSLPSVLLSVAFILH